MARRARGAAVEALARATGIPALPVESPRGLNDPWLHAAANVFAQADAVLLLGKRLDYGLRFGDAGVFAADRRLIQVDWDAAALAERRARRALRGGGSRPRRPSGSPPRPRRGVEARGVGRGSARHAREPARRAGALLRKATTRPIHPLRVCAALQPHLDRGAILVADGGEYGQWIQAGCEAGTRLINGPSGSIGSAIPMALGAKAAYPDRMVIAALGDGTFGFHAFELDTALATAFPWSPSWGTTRAGTPNISSSSSTTARNAR